MYSETDWQNWLAKCDEVRRISAVDRSAATALIRELLVDAELMLSSSSATATLSDLSRVRTELQEISDTLENWRDDCKVHLQNLSTATQWAESARTLG